MKIVPKSRWFMKTVPTSRLVHENCKSPQNRSNLFKLCLRSDSVAVFLIVVTLLRGPPACFFPWLRVLVFPFLLDLLAFRGFVQIGRASRPHAKRGLFLRSFWHFLVFSDSFFVVFFEVFGSCWALFGVLLGHFGYFLRVFFFEVRNKWVRIDVFVFWYPLTLANLGFPRAQFSFARISAFRVHWPFWSKHVSNMSSFFRLFKCISDTCFDVFFGVMFSNFVVTFGLHFGPLWGAKGGNTGGQ